MIVLYQIQIRQDDVDSIGEGLAAVEGTRNAQRYRMQYPKGKRKVELEAMVGD